MVHREDCHAMLLRREICFKHACKISTFAIARLLKIVRYKKKVCKTELQKLVRTSASLSHTESKIRKQRHFDQVESPAVLSIYSKWQTMNERHRSNLQIFDVQNAQGRRGLKTVEVPSLERKDGCSAKVVALPPSLKHKNWKEREL